LLISERKQRADASSLPAFACNLDGQLDQRLQNVGIVFGDLTKDALKHGLSNFNRVPYFAAGRDFRKLKSAGDRSLKKDETIASLSNGSSNFLRPSPHENQMLGVFAEIQNLRDSRVRVS
jgi:hypothetical protein